MNHVIQYSQKFIMDMHEIINDIIVFYQDAPYVAIAIALLALFFIFRFTKLFLKVVLLALVLSVIFYLIINLASSGVSQKERLIEKGRVTDTEK